MTLGDTTSDNLEDDNFEELAVHDAKSVITRLGLLERDSRSHARSITNIANTFKGYSGKISELLEWKMEQTIRDVRDEERNKALDVRLSSIEKAISEGFRTAGDEIKNIKGFGMRLFWIAAGVGVPTALAGLALVLIFGARELVPLP